MNILINGASRGMGRATAVIMSENPENSVYVAGRDSNALRSLSESSSNGNIHFFVFDFTERGKWLESILNSFRKHSIKIDILINSAGLLEKSLFKSSSEGSARAMMDVNFFGPVVFIRELLPFMNANSHIVNIGSMGGFQGSVKFPGLSWYSASKAALASMTESLATELSDMNISINCLCPGAVQTEMLEKAFPGYKAPLSSSEMGNFIADFAMNGHRFFNGKILPVSTSTP